MYVLDKYFIHLPNTYMFYNCLDVNHDETVLIEYVDFGNEETLQFKDIKKIPDMYLKLPKQVGFN